MQVIGPRAHILHHPSAFLLSKCPRLLHYYYFLLLGLGQGLLEAGGGSKSLSVF